MKFKNCFKLSIIIPVFNAEKRINKCLTSVFSLKKKIDLNRFVEVVIINDSSTDKSNKIIKNWKKKIKNLKIIKNKNNLGVSFSRNKGLNCSSGKYVFFLDADDYIISKNFFRFFKIIDNEDFKDVFIFHNIIEGKNFLSKPKINKIYNKKFSECLFNGNSKLTKYNIWRCIIKRDFLIKKKIYFEKLNQFEDWVFYAKLISHKPSFVEIKKYLYSYNYSIDNSLTKETHKKNIYNSIFAYNYIKKVSKKNINEKKIIEKMLFSLRRILFADLFLIKINKLFIFKKKYPFLSKMINQNIKYRELIEKEDKNIMIFCAGRIGRNLTVLTPKNRLCRFIIDNNRVLFNKNINGYKIKNFSFFSKNIQKFLEYRFIIANFEKKDVINIQKNIIKNGIKKQNVLLMAY
tara:strand:+ start:489 stop:1700 length:1212 start_codon:yes stop_codon:yes gene_type:complete